MNIWRPYVECSKKPFHIIDKHNQIAGYLVNMQYQLTALKNTSLSFKTVIPDSTKHPLLKLLISLK